RGAARVGTRLARHSRLRPGHRRDQTEHVQRWPADPHCGADRQADPGGACMTPRILLPVLLAACASWCVATADAPRPAPEAAPAGDAVDFLFLGEARPILVRLHITAGGKPLYDAWDGFIRAVFQFLDTDGDGVLTKDEAERAPPAGVLFAGGFFGNFQ